MKNKLFYFFILFITILSLFGCQDFGMEDTNQEENEGKDMYQVDIFDFAFIKKAPEATEKHDINNVIKVYFNENDSSLDKGFAIDLEKEHVFINPRMGSRGVRTSIEEPIQVSDITSIIEVDRKSTRLNSSHVAISYA